MINIIEYVYDNDHPSVGLIIVENNILKVYCYEGMQEPTINVTLLGEILNNDPSRTQFNLYELTSVNLEEANQRTCKFFSPPLRVAENFDLELDPNYPFNRHTTDGMCTNTEITQYSESPLYVCQYSSSFCNCIGYAGEPWDEIKRTESTSVPVQFVSISKSKRGLGIDTWRVTDNNATVEVRLNEDKTSEKQVEELYNTLVEKIDKDQRTETIFDTEKSEPVKNSYFAKVLALTES